MVYGEDNNMSYLEDEEYITKLVNAYKDSGVDWDGDDNEDYAYEYGQMEDVDEDRYKDGISKHQTVKKTALYVLDELVDLQASIISGETLLKTDVNTEVVIEEGYLGLSLGDMTKEDIATRLVVIRFISNLIKKCGVLVSTEDKEELEKIGQDVNSLKEDIVIDDTNKDTFKLIFKTITDTI